MSYSEMKEKLKKVKEEKLQVCKDLFNQASKKLFKDNPTLESFRWTQYTDYWNDGDLCRFHVHSDCADINEVNGYDLEEDIEEQELSYKELEELQCKVTQFLDEFDNEDMEEMFGDHKAITCYRDGRVEVDDYSDHD